LALELMHAYKLATYLDAKHETRRLMWTLAHAHGVGLGLLHLGFVATLRACFRIATPALALASRLLAAATLLVPLGFFLGGVTTYESDPGGGVFLVPIGAVALWLALLLIARDVFRA
jgi:hypothetical protein